MIDWLHPNYTKMRPLWQKCRDVIEGEDAVKEQGETYLPRLSGHDDIYSDQFSSAYHRYLMRAEFFNATGRTVDGLTGMVFRKAPVVEFPLEPWLDRVSSDGLSIHEFAEKCVDEVVSVGRGGVLVDYPVTDQPMRVVDSDAMGVWPYLSLYTAESIINWRSDVINGVSKLSLVVLEETHWESVHDEFERVPVKRYRVLDVLAGEYRQRLYEKTDDKENPWLLMSEEIPRDRRGNSFLEIPFFFLGVSHSSPMCEMPPLLDLVNTNLAHYRLSADLANGRHRLGVPTPWISGSFAGGEEVLQLRLGSEEAIHLATGGSVGMLEFTGSGLTSLETGIQKLEERMILLGARILSPDRRAVEAAETARIHRSGEDSVLASIANATSKVLTRAIDFVRGWMALEGDVSFELNTDYTPGRAESADILAWLQLWQSGRLSSEQLFRLLQEGEIVGDLSFDEHEEQLSLEGPALGMIGDAFSQ